MPTKPSRDLGIHAADVYGKFESVNIPKMSRGSIMGHGNPGLPTFLLKEIWEPSQICKDAPIFCNTSSQSVTDGLNLSNISVPVSIWDA